jgi:hypothetical protein
VGLWDRLHKDDEVVLGDQSGPTGLTIADTVAAIKPQPARQEVWGRPSRCPQCGDAGYLDRVDVVDRIQYEHCPSCFHKWSVREEETVHAEA